MQTPETPQRVLLVEDEAVISLMFESMLINLGYTVDVTSFLDEALDAAQSNAYLFAMLDLNLNGEESYPIADCLSAKAVPIIFVTGYSAQKLKKNYPAQTLLTKPFRPRELRESIAQVLGKKSQSTRQG